MIEKLTVAPFLVMLAMSSGAVVARADPDTDRAAGEALFDSALTLVGQGNFAEGCPKFEASLKLLPSSSTLIHIAQCHEHDGKIAAAWADYRQALAVLPETRGADRQKALEAIAKKGLDDLEPRLPRLRIVIAEKPEGLVVKRDGRDLPLASLGEPLPEDPGDHVVIATAPGFEAAEQKTRCDEGKTAVVTLALMRLDTTPIPIAVVPPPPPSPPPPMPDAPPARTKVPAWTIVAGAGGLVMLGVSAGFLADDISAINTLRGTCSSQGDRVTCPPGYDYQADNERKNRSAALFTVFGIAGVVATGAAVVGLVTAPRTRGSNEGVAFSPWMGPSSGGASVAGAF